MIQDIKQTGSSDAASEGTVAHEIAESCLTMHKLPASFIGETLVLDTGYEQEVDEDMARYIGEYVDYVVDLAQDATALLVEQSVCYDNWVRGGFGTADAIIQDANTRTLHVVDLKYGRGIFVSAEDNSQLKLYGLGALQEFGNDCSWETIVLHIVQPRMTNFQSVTMSVDDLLAWAEEVVSPAALETEDPEARFGPSDKACQWCPAAGSCQALAEHSFKVISSNFQDLNEPVQCKNPDKLSQQEIGLLLPQLPLIDKWVRAVNEYALETIAQGQEIPGYKLVEGRANRSWTGAAEQVLVDALGDEAWNMKLIGITAAEKKLGKDIVNSVAEKKPGKPTLTVESDKRPALKPIKDMFGELK
jgi:hypothetical protein